MKFHQRFDIQIGLEDARRKFVNRAYNLIFIELYYSLFTVSEKVSLEERIATRLGERFEGIAESKMRVSSQFRESIFEPYVKKDFYRTLQAIEEIALFVHEKVQNSRTSGYQEIEEKLEGYIRRLIEDSEVDLGISWENRVFQRKGAELLDQVLVNDVLKWLRAKGHESVVMPFEKGLKHFLESTHRLEILSDVVTDMYESLEAFAKIVCGNNDDLSANQERFLSIVKASEAYKRVFKEYIRYANEFRHGAKEGKPKPNLSEREVESFMYLTGVFIRLAIPDKEKK